MPLLLGIDTGGTYTDAVLFDETRPDPVVAKAKALTTRADLSIGISGAIGRVLADSGTAPGSIGLVSISTTLATNALVEGQGGRVALVFVGFDADDAQRGGLPKALDGDPLIAIAGGHTPDGSPAAAPDIAALDAALDALAPRTSAFAVVARFASRDTGHERLVRDHLHDRTGLPVTCGHELSARLNGPLRAVTAVLNARLIGMIAALIDATEATMAASGIKAPLMLVRGDGALVSAEFARTRPIETILSGPAASLVGAGVLTGQSAAVVADIGGTTTDIAVLTGGRPRLNPEGAEVGGFRTMVEAVDMRAVGLGGDSEVHISEEGLSAALTLGPRRVVPLSLLAVDHRDTVMSALDRQSRLPRVDRDAARFAVATGRRPRGPLPDEEAEIGALLEDGPVALDRLAGNRRQLTALNRAVVAGRARIAGFTPSDAAHVLGLHAAWDGAAAALAADLLARRRDGRGQPVAPDGPALARMVIDRLTRQSGDEILRAALEADGLGLGDISANPAIQAGLDGHTGTARLNAGLALPLVGLGASAPTYYPAVARRLGTEAAIPEHADVANAVGAVAGRVSVTATILVSAPPEGGFRVHAGDAPLTFADAGAARDAALIAAADAALAAARAAGAADPEVETAFEAREATVEGQVVLIEGTARATAQGRPRVGRV